MNYYIFIIVMVIIFLDLFVMGITSSIATNSINNAKNNLSKADKQNSVTYKAYEISQNSINNTVWCTWISFGIVIVAIIGYLAIKYIPMMSESGGSEGKSGGGEGGGGESGGGEGGESGGEMKGKAEEDEKGTQNSHLFTLIFLGAVGSLYFSTGFAIYASMQLDWAAKISEYEGYSSIVGDNGQRATLITVITGLAVALPIFMWGVYEFYTTTSK